MPEDYITILLLYYSAKLLILYYSANYFQFLDNDWFILGFPVIENILKYS